MRREDGVGSSRTCQPRVLQQVTNLLRTLFATYKVGIRVSILLNYCQDWKFHEWEGRIESLGLADAHYDIQDG